MERNFYMNKKIFVLNFADHYTELSIAVMIQTMAMQAWVGSQTAEKPGYVYIDPKEMAREFSLNKKEREIFTEKNIRRTIKLLESMGIIGKVKNGNKYKPTLYEYFQPKPEELAE